MNNASQISQEEYEWSQNALRALDNYFSAHVVGQKPLEAALVGAVLGNGHVLIESVPGLAKTTAARAIADSVNGRFSRIQCTPDLLPGDIIGTQIYRQDSGKFETVLGPVFANFVLLDEINRSSAKTQSAMLEAMAEKQVTIGGKSYRMPEETFIVFATQNPIEQEGTYPLSEITYPTAEEEVSILNMIEEEESQQKMAPVLNIEDVARLQRITANVYCDPAIKTYIASIVCATRMADQYLPTQMRGYVNLGASPRATIAFLKMSKASAIMQGRVFVTPDDVKFVAKQVLRHRLALRYIASADGINEDMIIESLLANIRTP